MPEQRESRLTVAGLLALLASADDERRISSMKSLTEVEPGGDELKVTRETEEAYTGRCMGDQTSSMPVMSRQLPQEVPQVCLKPDPEHRPA
jgi:hypothetical protein